MEVTIHACIVHICGLLIQVFGSLIRLDKVKQSANSFVITVLVCLIH